MKFISSLIFALACCLWSSLVLSDDASDAFMQGSAAFNRQDYDAAFPLFLKAAEMGNMSAQFSAGTLYKIGYGTKQNSEKAREWIGKAAEQGYSVAQQSLGEMFESGAGGVKDLRQAFFWYSKAAAQGNDDGYWGKKKLLEYGDAGSQYARGVEYEIGSGVPVDYAEALHWFELAAAQGLRDAQSKVNFYYEKRMAEQRSIVNERKEAYPAQARQEECGWACMNARAAEEDLAKMRRGGVPQKCTQPGFLGIRTCN